MNYCIIDWSLLIVEGDCLYCWLCLKLHLGDHKDYRTLPYRRNMHQHFICTWHFVCVPQFSDTCETRPPLTNALVYEHLEKAKHTEQYNEWDSLQQVSHVDVTGLCGEMLCGH